VSYFRSKANQPTTMGTIWQAKAIVGLAKQLLDQPHSQEARIALARGIVECGKAIEAHELSTPPLPPRNPIGQPVGNP
jgi:hypothetical protein